MSDERLKKSVDNRESRAMTDRTVTEDRVLSDDERVEMFRQQFFSPHYRTCRQYQAGIHAG